MYFEDIDANWRFIPTIGCWRSDSGDGLAYGFRTGVQFEVCKRADGRGEIHLSLEYGLLRLDGAGTNLDLGRIAIVLMD